MADSAYISRRADDCDVPEVALAEEIVENHDRTSM
jgi:hypothetical protein